MHVDFLFLLTIAILPGGIAFFVILLWYFIVILMWNSLMSSDDWHLKIHLLSICLLLTNVPSGPLLIFRLSYFLVAAELSLLHTLADHTIPDMSQTCSALCKDHTLCVFYVLFSRLSLCCCCLCCAETFKFDAIPFVYFGFFFFCLCFWGYIQESLSKLMSWSFPFVFYIFRSGVHSGLIFVYSTR